MRLCACVPVLWITIAIGTATASTCAPHVEAPKNCCNFAQNISCCRDWSQTPMDKACPVSHPTLDNISISQDEHELGFKWSVANTENIIGYRLQLSCSWTDRDNSTADTKSDSECFEVNRADSTNVHITPYACKTRFSWLPVNCLHSTIFSEFYHSAHQDDTAQCTLSISSLPLSNTTAVPVKRFALSSCRQRGCPAHAFDYVHRCSDDNIAKQLTDFKGGGNYSNIRLCDCDIRRPSAVKFSKGALWWSHPKDVIFTARQYEVRYWNEKDLYFPATVVWCNNTKRPCHMNFSSASVSSSNAILHALGVRARSATPRDTHSAFVWVKVVLPDKSPTSTATTTQPVRATSQKATSQKATREQATDLTGRTSFQSQSSTPRAAHEAPSKKSDDLLVVILVAVVVLCICVVASLFARRACRRSVTEAGARKAGLDSSHRDRESPDSDGKSVAFSEALSVGSECIKYPLKAPTLDSRLAEPITDVFISFARYPNSNHEAAVRLALLLRQNGLVAEVASPELHVDDEYCCNVPEWIDRQMNVCRHILVIVSRFYPHCRNDSLTGALRPAPSVSPPPMWAEHGPIPAPLFNCHKEGETQPEEEAPSDPLKDCLGRGELCIDYSHRLDDLLRKTEAKRQAIQQEAMRAAADSQHAGDSLAKLDPFAALECRLIDGMKMDEERLRDIIPVYLDSAALAVKLPAYLEPCYRYFANAHAPAAIPPSLRDMTGDLDALVTRLAPGPPLHIHQKQVRCDLLYA